VITPVENNSTTDGTIPAVRYPVALLTSALVLTALAFACFGWVIFDSSGGAKIARVQSTRMEELTIGALTVLAVSFAAWWSVLRGLRRWRIDLEQAVGERRQAEQALRRAHDELEVRIAQRTAELEKANQTLQAENSERTQMEMALRVSEEQFRAMFELASVGIAQADPRTGRWLLVNQKMCAITGYSAAEMLQMRIAEITHPEDREKDWEKFEGVVRGGSPDYRMEKRYIRKDGTLAWVNVNMTIIRDAAGQSTRTMATIEDITERKELEAQMERLRTEHAGILNSIGEGVHWIDADGRIKFENPAAAKMLGYEVSELIGQPAHATMHHTRADGTAYPQSECPIYATLRDGVVRRVTDEVFWRKDGTSFAVDYLCTPVRDKNGRSSGSVVIFTDITERKQAEAKLAETHEQLVDASRLAGMAEVATSVLHNVGNVLNSVGVSATLVANHVRHTKAVNIAKVAALFDQHQADLAGFLATDPRGQTIPAYLGSLAESIAAEQATLLAELAYLRKNIEHIKDIVAMQQAYAVTSGGTETISIPDLIEEALRIDADALARYNVTTIRDHQARPVIATNKHKVLQIIINLVRNAKLACVDSGRTDKQVTVRTTSDDRSVKIAIVDNGVGIPAENLTRIFNHGFTTRKTGHGFALHSGALAAKELGGALTVQSEGPGKGAVFTLEIPIAAPQPPA
jgi:PAS domain S-box-containing protein